MISSQTPEEFVSAIDLLKIALREHAIEAEDRKLQLAFEQAQRLAKLKKSGTED